MTETILSVDKLVKHYPVTRGVVFKKTIGHVRAVDGVSLELKAGETLGVVGESGCGKSTLARVVMNLEKPTSGSVSYRGEKMSGIKGAALRRMRRQIQLVMPDPSRSLNPRRTVGDLIGEPFEIHPDVAPKGDRLR